VLPLLAEPKQIVRAESTSTCTAGIDTNHSTMFTLLVKLNVICAVHKGGYSWNCKIVSAEYCAQQRASTNHGTQLLSSSQRHKGAFGFGGREGRFSIHPNFCATVRKTNRKVLQAMILLEQFAQTYREVFLEIVLILPESSSHLVRL